MIPAICIALILVNAVVFHLLVWLPIRDAMREAARDPGPRSKGTFKAEICGTLSLFVFAPACGFAWYGGLAECSRINAPAMHGAIFVIPPDNILWACFAVFLGILSGCVTAMQLSALLLGSKFNEALRISAGTVSRLKALLLPAINVLVAVAACVLIPLALGWYVCFRSDGIVINRLFTLGEVRYRYDEITDIARVQKFPVPNGNLKDRPHIALRFSDGTIWKSVDEGRSQDLARDIVILQLLSRTTTLTPTDHDVLPW